MDLLFVLSVGRLSYVEYFEYVVACVVFCDRAAYIYDILFLSLCPFVREDCGMTGSQSSPLYCQFNASEPGTPIVHSSMVMEIHGCLRDAHIERYRTQKHKYDGKHSKRHDSEDKTNIARGDERL